MPKKKSLKECYLCGTLCSYTRDHIFPRGLFPDPAPTNLPTAPACETCNNSLNKDEELFRNFVASGMAYEFPSGKSIWDGHIDPSLRKNRAGIKTLVVQLTKERPFYSSDGKYLGQWFTFEPPAERIYRVLHKIAKGLYYLKNKKPMPEEAEFYCIPSNETPEKLIEEPWSNYFPGGQPSVLGDYVVAYWQTVAYDDPAATATWMVFYRCNAFLLLTYPKDWLNHHFTRGLSGS
jgi:hypothetical protein